MNKQFWHNRKVLITGHTGFKGSWLSLWLQQLGADICGLSLAPNTQPSLFELANLTENMDSHILDISQPGSAKKVLNQFKPEIVIHMAAQPLVRLSYKNPVQTYQTNVMGTVHLLEAARSCASVKAVVNVTTDKCYQNNEWIWGYRENEPMGGHDPYSNSKGCSELVTSAYRESFFKKMGKGLASARAGNVIGGGDWSDDRLISDIIKNICNHKTTLLRHPKAVRPWQHVLEPLSGYLLLAEKLYNNPKDYSSAWNFGPNHNQTATVEQVADKVFSSWGEDQLGWQVEPDVNALHEAQLLRLDITKATTQLDWQPKLDLDTTINWTIDWYKAWAEGKNIRSLSLQQIQAYLSEKELEYDY